MADNIVNAIIAALVDVSIKRGDAAVFTIPLYDPNNNNAPVDLSVYSRFVAHVKIDKLRDSEVISLDSDVASEIVQGGTDDNELTFTITSTKSDVKYGKYVWDVEGIGGSQDPTTLIEGSFEVSQDVTRIAAP